MKQKLCECGCGQVVRPGRRFISGHNVYVKHPMENAKSRKKLSESLKKEVFETKPQQYCACGCGNITNPGNKYIHGHNIKGKSFTEDHKEKIKLSNIKTWSDLKRLEEHSKLMKKVTPMGKLSYEELFGKERTKYQKENGCGYGHKIDCQCFICRTAQHKITEEEERKRWENSRISLLRNQPWSFLGQGFDSKEESEIAKLRFKLFGIVPIYRNNYQKRIGKNGKSCDFYQFGFFHEHHPEWNHNHKQQIFDPKDKYYQQRRKILDKNGYNDYELIHTTSVKEAEQMYEWLAEKLQIGDEINAKN
jgi:hypothetical protein